MFWNPGCGFCEAMHEDIRAWERRPPPAAPRLVLVSNGDGAANRRMGLSSIVLLDESFSVGPRFGVNGTPSAVLLEADGRVASEVAVGAPGVLELAGGSGHASLAAEPADGAPAQL